jgi:hypothetical protein
MMGYERRIAEVSKSFLIACKLKSTNLHYATRDYKLQGKRLFGTRAPHNCSIHSVCNLRSPHDRGQVYQAGHFTVIIYDCLVD